MQIIDILLEYRREMDENLKEVKNNLQKTVDRDSMQC